MPRRSPVLPLLSLTFAVISPAAAQNKLEFEAASVRQSGQPSQECFGKSLGPGTADPTRVHYGCYSVIAVIMDAYSLAPYRLVNTEKANGIYVDISATMKPGTTRVEMQQMLQNLLAERLHLRTRTEMRDSTVYELAVEKGGPKLKAHVESRSAPNTIAGPLKTGADGMPDFPSVAGQITGGFGSPLKTRAIGTAVPVSDLATYLESRLRAPVTDKTGLQGTYDFRLDFLDPNYDNPLSPDADAFPPLPAALSSQLGLRLESKKGPVPYLVIESIDKTPTEN